MIRSISRAVDARLSSAWRRGGEAEVGQRLLGRCDPALADAGALADPLVGGVHHRRELVVRDHALGNVAAEARDRDADAVGVADHRLHREGQCAAHRELSADVAAALPWPIGPRTSRPALEDELVARLDYPLEAHVVDPGEEREAAAVLLL